MLSNQGDLWGEGRRVYLTYLLKTRERRQVAHLAPEQVTVRGRMLGHQSAFLGKCCWGTAYERGSAPGARVQQSDLQLRDSKAEQEDAGQRRAQKSQLQEHNHVFTKNTFQGTYLEKDELVSSMHHHHSTCCPKEDSPMSVGKDSAAPWLWSDRDNL